LVGRDPSLLNVRLLARHNDPESNSEREFCDRARTALALSLFGVRTHVACANCSTPAFGHLLPMVMGCSRAEAED
jgi:hypothetical protein